MIIMARKVDEKKEIVKKNPTRQKIIVEQGRAMGTPQVPHKVLYTEIVASKENAKERVKEGKIQTNEELYNKLKQTLEDTTKVKEFNKKKIEEIVSEGLVDLDYAFGFTECTSLRIGRYK